MTEDKEVNHEENNGRAVMHISIFVLISGISLRKCYLLSCVHCTWAGKDIPLFAGLFFEPFRLKLIGMSRQQLAIHFPICPYK